MLKLIGNRLGGEFVLWAIVGLLLMAVVIGLFAKRSWPAEIFLSVFPQIAAGALVFTVMLVVMGRPIVAAIPLAIAAALLWETREAFARPEPRLLEPHMRIVWTNVFNRPESFARAIELAARVDADVVLIAEYPTHLDEGERRRLRGAYAHEAGEPTGAPTNISAFSRLPIEAVAVTPARKRRGLALIVRAPLGKLRIVGVHPAVPATPGMIRNRADTIDGAIGAFSDGEAGVLVGDLNTVSWSPTLRRIGHKGRRISYGPASTWMSPLPILGLPIDHAFAFGDVQASARVGGGIGSDHFPLIVDVRIADVERAVTLDSLWLPSPP